MRCLKNQLVWLLKRDMAVIFESNHIVAEDARLLNLYGLEVLSRAEQVKKQANEKEAQSI